MLRPLAGAWGACLENLPDDSIVDVCIAVNERPRLHDALAEVGVLDGGQPYEIRISMEQVLQSLRQPEIGVGIPVRGPVVELHDEMRVAVAAAPELSVSAPTQVHDLDKLRVQMWSVLPDGRLFVGMRNENEDEITRYSLVLNWTEELKRKMRDAR